MNGIQSMEASFTRNKGNGAPSEQDLPLIQKLALIEVDPEKLYVREVTACSDQLDRAYGRIPEPYLQRLAETLPGKSLLLNHDSQSEEVACGLVHSAQVRPSQAGEPGTHVLVARFYLVRDSESEDYIRRMDAGIIRHCSICFRYDKELCDVCELDYWQCPHTRGQRLDDGRRVTYHFAGELDRYEALELSLVYLGRQYGSEIRHSDRKEPMEEKILAALAALTTTVTTLGDQVKQLSAPKPEAPPAPKSETDNASLALIEDGKAYRLALAQTIRKNAALLKGEKQAELALKGAVTAAELAELGAEYERLVEAAFPNSPTAQTNAPASPAAETETRHRALSLF